MSELWSCRLATKRCGSTQIPFCRDVGGQPLPVFCTLGTLRQSTARQCEQSFVLLAGTRSRGGIASLLMNDKTLGCWSSHEPRQGRGIQHADKPFPLHTQGWVDVFPEVRFLFRLLGRVQRRTKTRRAPSSQVPSMRICECVLVFQVRRRVPIIDAQLRRGPLSRRLRRVPPRLARVGRVPPPVAKVNDKLDVAAGAAEARRGAWHVGPEPPLVAADRQHPGGAIVRIGPAAMNAAAAIVRLKVRRVRGGGGATNVRPKAPFKRDD